MTAGARAALAIPRRDVLAIDSALLATLKLVSGLLVLRAGFSHVSDDDYARTVIAEQFARAPRLDPSGTSWLPLPFWLAGSAMALAGRSLASARAIAVVLGVASVGAPYAAARVAGVARAPAFAAVALAMMLPWNAWLGVATVPDGWAGALVGAAGVAIAVDRAAPWCAVALLAGSLSRYEAWPVCGVLAGACVVRASPGSRRELTWAAVALAGPLLWMAWNAHAHGSPLHFVARVTAFRRAIGAAAVPWGDKVLGYPRALVTETPEVALLGACGAAGLVASETLWIRWRLPALAACAVLAFLVVGDLGDGAPTHHPARALGSLWWILVTMGADALATGAAALQGRSRRTASIGASILAVTWLASLSARWSAAPGETDLERREAQIARGLDLRARDVPAAAITPCAFEHFALLAAWGEPERATIGSRSGAPPTAECPRVEVP